MQRIQRRTEYANVPKWEQSMQGLHSGIGYARDSEKNRVCIHGLKSRTEYASLTDQNKRS